MPQQSRNIAQILAAASAISFDPERASAVEAVFERARQIAEALAAIDYGSFEPASRFRPPPPPSP
jgi:phage portal protein BeeE